MDTQELLLTSTPGNITENELPPVNFSHVVNLTDDTGIIQHAIYDIPNRKEGYCIDDNSRALLLMVMSAGNGRERLTARLIPIYLGFIHYMQNEDGTFRNFMCYDRSCYEKAGSEDSFGRTLMALGYLVNENSVPSMVKAATEIFHNAVHRCNDLHSLRGRANSIIGLCKFAASVNNGSEYYDLISRMADSMVTEYRLARDKNWHWFEAILTYDNAMLPLALLHAFEFTKNNEYQTIALESLAFLESKVLRDEVLYPIGNMGWLPKGGEAAIFDQQGIDAMAMVLCYQQAYQLTGHHDHLKKMLISYQWFLGSNVLNIPLYDPHTGGCADGLQQHGINFNYGAESTLAYWISHMAVANTLKQ